ncbi:MAG: nicotinate-nucleotide adenylyltransferase [Leptolyngbyaceae cyanobacterium bins.349]|nr:nicotinate-nucleotide adenylyltransferase [Leptolyngbyaceae cyanobacterium bins.349]
MLNIALFGTSADPPTLGHQAILEWLSHHFDWVAVWAADNPFKGHQTPLAHRTQMLSLLIEALHLPSENVHLYPELGQSRTIYTLEIAKQRWKQAQFTLVIGSDLVEQLPNWYRAEELLREVNLLIVPRPGYPLREHALAILRQQGATVAIADLMGPDTSSTAVREHGESTGLTPPIEAYIHREHLYLCQDVPKERQPVR